MEIIRENLLIILALISQILFMVIWSHYYDGPFRRMFIHSRKKNVKYEYGLMGSVAAICSIVVCFIYQCICKVMDYQGVSVISIIFPFLVLLTNYLLTNIVALKKNVTQFMILIMLWFNTPIVFLMCVGRYQIGLDFYCGKASLVLAVLDVFLLRKSLLYWKKGDL